MRFNNRGAFRVLTACLSKKRIFQRILKTNLGLSFADTEKIFDANKKILNLPQYRIINNSLLCQKYNVDPNSLKDFSFCLLLSTVRLEHRINILKDIGVPHLNVTLITRITSRLHKPVFIFKGETNIPPEQNIAKNILSRVDEHSTETSQLESLSDQISTREYYQKCLLHCKVWKFHLSYLNDEIFLRKYMIFKSISMIGETLKVLKVDVGYDDELIKTYPYAIIASADNIRSLLNNFKDTDICGIPITTLLKKHPYILFEDANNIKQLLMSFKQYEIPDQYVKKCLKIFKVGNDVFLERIESIKRHPDLHVWYKCPRVLQLIIHKDMANDRLGYLRMVNRVKWARLHTVLSDKHKIEKFIQFNGSKVISKKYLKHVFATELGSDKVDLVEKLTRHQHWKTAGFIDVKQMLKYLKTKYTINEISDNIHIVLYTQSVIEKLLIDLKQQYSGSTEFSFTNGQYLALCLYMLEKDNQFTGDSVWFNGHNTENSPEHLNKQNTMEYTNLPTQDSETIDSDLYDRDKI